MNGLILTLARLLQDSLEVYTFGLLAIMGVVMVCEGYYE
jgi:hypothetical protein